MITRDLVAIVVPGSRYQGPAIERADGERLLAERSRRAFSLVAVPSCHCCGEPAWENRRCTKHQDRNPCVVEGCTRTAKAPDGRLGSDQVVCGEHWRRFVPPGSRGRRAYNRHRARGRRLDWPPEAVEAFHRFWDLLVAQIRRRAADPGHLDQREIERMFGWDG